MLPKNISELKVCDNITKILFFIYMFTYSSFKHRISSKFEL